MAVDDYHRPVSFGCEPPHNGTRKVALVANADPLPAMSELNHDPPIAASPWQVCYAGYSGRNTTMSGLVVFRPGRGQA